MAEAMGGGANMPMPRAHSNSEGIDKRRASRWKRDWGDLARKICKR